MMTRRDFLKTLLAGAAISTLGASTFAQTVFPTFAVPPSIMLHSDYNHRRILPELITTLRAHGYEGITYRQFLAHTTQGAPIPPKPVIISVDDLTMAQGVPAYHAFIQFYEIFKRYEFAGVFAVNTLPYAAQDMSRWKQVATWAQDERIEFATHTSSHYNLNEAGLSLTDMQCEVCDSARMMTRYIGQPVKTLVLPFGNGYDMTSGEIRPEITACCKEAGIRFVVGIAGGRKPVCCYRADTVMLMGRVGPGAKRGEETVESALWEVEHW